MLCYKTTDSLYLPPCFQGEDETTALPSYRLENEQYILVDSDSVQYDLMLVSFFVGSSTTNLYR